MNKTTRLRLLLKSNQLEFLLEAHNGLSARIAEEAGFKGIWASGLCLSAQHGVRDCNEASWTQVLEMLEFMADATTIPVLLDGDTGYGNFNNVRRLVRKLEQRGIAGVCIEDKLFPKANSFLRGETQPLADVGEFCGRIRAGKSAQKDEDFCIVARTEALIAGWGLDEALERAGAYFEAGADAILIHSSKSTAEEILAFKRIWGERCPVVIVPTKYYATPTEEFERAGISVAIWANHMLRASITVMQETARMLYENRSLLAVEGRVASLAEVFRLQRAGELDEAEEKFLPRPPRRCGVILAASRGKQLGALTETIPKTMIKVKGKPILQHIVEAFRAVGIRDLSVVRGYCKETIDIHGVRFVDNDEYENTGELYSFALALQGLTDETAPVIVGYGDVVFNEHVLRVLLDTEGDIVVPVDTHWEQSANRDRHADYATCSAPHARHAGANPVTLGHVGGGIESADRHGEWMGFLRVDAAMRPAVQQTLERLLCDDENRCAGMGDLLNALIADGHEIRVVYTTGHWLDVDSVMDAVQAGSF